MLQFQAILHPTDFSEQSTYAFRLACSLARDHGARLIILHAWSRPVAFLPEGVPVTVRPDEDYLATLEQELHQLRVPDNTIRVDYQLKEGSAAEAILDVARESNCDIIVMGTHGRTGLGRLVMGSVAEQVVRKAPCPVLTVKAPVASAESGSEQLSLSGSHI